LEQTVQTPRRTCRCSGSDESKLWEGRAAHPTRPVGPLNIRVQPKPQNVVSSGNRVSADEISSGWNGGATMAVSSEEAQKQWGWSSKTEAEPGVVQPRAKGRQDC
jgi:hypothetical protein